MGTPLEETQRRTQEWVHSFSNRTHINRIEVLIGQDEGNEQASGDQGPHQAKLTFNIDQRGLEEKLSQEIREFAAHHPGVSIKIKRPSLLTLKPPLRIVLRGHQLPQLQKAEEAVLDLLKRDPLISDLEGSFGQGYPEVRVQYDYSRLTRLGTSPRSIATQIRNQLTGTESFEVQWSGIRLPILVKGWGVDLKNTSDLPNLEIQTPNYILPLEAIAQLNPGEGPADIRHVDGQRASEVSGYVSAFELGTRSKILKKKLAQLQLPLGVEVSMSGQDQEMEGSLTQLFYVLLLSLFLVYVVMATQFENIRLPLLIMGSVPLASLGVFIGLWWTQTPLSVVVFVGLITLSGVVVNNAIVYLDTTHRFVLSGLDRTQALMPTGQQRLRPILMTTLTTLIGLIPMLSSQSEGAELRIPLALTLMFGLASSTVLVLYVIPALYLLFGGKAKSTC